MNIEENKTKEQTTENESVDTNQNYIEMLDYYKKNSVPKEQFDKVFNENKQLLSNWMNNIPSPESEATAKKTVNVDELRKEIFSGELDNLTYWKKVLQLRDSLIAAGETDPFLPVGNKIAPTQEDIDAAARVAQGVKECIEDADGDSYYFTNELNRRMIDHRR